MRRGDADMGRGCGRPRRRGAWGLGSRGGVVAGQCPRDDRPRAALDGAGADIAADAAFRAHARTSGVPSGGSGGRTIAHVDDGRTPERAREGACTRRSTAGGSACPSSTMMCVCPWSRNDTSGLPLDMPALLWAFSPPSGWARGHAAQ